MYIIPNIPQPRAHYFSVGQDIVGRKNLLIVAGCSWVCGDGTAPELVGKDERDRVQYDRAFGARLGESLDADVINLGKCAGSNDYIYESLIRIMPEINKIHSNYDRVIVFAGMTEYSRIQRIPVTEKWFVDMQPGYRVPKELEVYTKHHLVHFDHLDAGHIELMRILLSIQNLCKANSAELYFAHMIGHELRIGEMSHEKREILDYYISQLDLDCYMHEGNAFNLPSFQSYLYDRGLKHHDDGDYYFTTCMHPTIEGHSMIADKIYNFIKSST